LGYLAGILLLVNQVICLSLSSKFNSEKSNWFEVEEVVKAQSDEVLDTTLNVLAGAFRSESSTAENAWRFKNKKFKLNPHSTGADGTRLYLLLCTFLI
jgi:hypothetical protein